MHSVTLSFYVALKFTWKDIRPKISFAGNNIIWSSAVSLRYIESLEMWTPHTGDESVVLLNVTPLILVNWNQNFAGTFCLLLQNSPKKSGGRVAVVNAASVFRVVQENLTFLSLLWRRRIQAPPKRWYLFTRL